MWEVLVRPQHTVNNILLNDFDIAVPVRAVLFVPETDNMAELVKYHAVVCATGTKRDSLSSAYHSYVRIASKNSKKI